MTHLLKMFETGWAERDPSIGRLVFIDCAFVHCTCDCSRARIFFLIIELTIFKTSRNDLSVNKKIPLT